MLAGRVDEFLGIDIAQGAVDRAREHHACLPNVSFEQADLLELPSSLDGRFDLVLVLDVLYYLLDLDDELLKQVVTRIADLSDPGGLCVLANHYFFGVDSNSRLSMRIHRAFTESPRFGLLSEHYRPFFLVSFFGSLPTPQARQQPRSTR
jgi:chemotaxis methyl-accepting protein methylase